MKKFTEKDTENYIMIRKMKFIFPLSILNLKIRINAIFS